MAFERLQTVQPERIGDIRVTLLQPTTGSERRARATAEIEVILSDGSHRTVRAEIADHFSTTVINQLIAFMNSVRSKAEAEILPE